MDEQVELVLPSLDEMERIYITHMLQITGTKDQAAKILGIATQTLHNKIKKHKIAVKRKPGRKSPPLKVNTRNTGKVPPSLAVRNHNNNQGEVSYTVSPEERDYYYNLDFLCGVYKKLKTHGLTPDPDVD